MTPPTDERAPTAPFDGAPIAPGGDPGAPPDEAAPIDATAAGPSLRRRLGRLLVLAASILLVVVVVAVIALVNVMRYQDEVTNPYFTAVTEADSAFISLIDAESSVRGYLATGTDLNLEAFERAVAEGRADTLHDSATTALLTLTPEVSAALDHASQAVHDWMADYALAAVEKTREEGPGAVTTDERLEGARLFEQARTELAEYIAVLREVRQDKVQALEVWTQVLFGAVVVLAVAAVLVGAFLWSVLKRWITDPVTTLAHQVRLVSDGHLHQPVSVEAPGEIGALAVDVEHMRTELVSQVAEIKESHEEVERSHELLAAQAQELARSNRDLEQFAYVASHDLQEPLRKVASFTQLLQKRYGGQLDERADQYIEFAVDGAKRMQRLIQDLLGFSRVGRAGIERAPVDLEASFAVVLADLEEKIAQSGASVTHDPLPTVAGERALLEQLFVNLVGNAVKFRDPDRTPEIHVGVRARAAAWEFAVVDNGIGIDAQYAERVFVIFQRLHPKDVYEGTGIGLALCKRIVEHHGGRIWIEQTGGGGTTVRFTIPTVGAARSGSGTAGSRSAAG
ncbi:sensor histidine kinase [Oerskovia turbata]